MAVSGVHDVVAQQVEERSGDCAVRDPAGGYGLSYGELWERAGWLAAELARRGVRRGDLVAVPQDRSVDLVVTFLGILRCGAAYLPLDGLAPKDRLTGIVAEAGTRWAVHSPRQDTLAGPAGRWADLASWLPSGVEPVPLPPADPGHPVPDPGTVRDDPAYVSFTSGSTGRPKGVVVPHRAVLRLALRSKFCSVEPGDQVASAANPAFDATTFELWNALTAGGTVVVFPAATDLPLDDWAALIRAERIDTMFLTTSLFHTVARERPDAFGALRNLVVGGEQLEMAAVRKVLAAGPPGRLVNGYGPTETTTFAAYFDCTEDSLAGLERIPVGHPLQDTTLHLLDPDLKPVPPGETGELCVGGPGVALGYLGREELTAERFVVHPATGERIYRTGDTGRQLPGGAIELFGRSDRQVKLRGFRIELEEIERAALACGLADSAFVEKVGEGPAASLVGFVLPSADGLSAAEAEAEAGAAAAALPAALNARLGRTLPGYMLPARWLVLDRVPLGSTGKADRARLLELLSAESSAAHPGGTARTTGATPATRTAERELVAPLGDIWREVLGVEQVLPEQNFLDLGGNSILAMQVAARARQRLGVPVDGGAVLLCDTLGELAAHVAEACAADGPAAGSEPAGAPQGVVAP
ncbi:non-ribosomal peptide synthetase [Streptomyces sp. NPDC088812]|uniref:non-ribosomal peptide synthetase n=1 Tax=Streptomyces sp. NPDC088812 TaxID=3365905 RepID=UPI00382F6A3C